MGQQLLLSVPQFPLLYRRDVLLCLLHSLGKMGGNTVEAFISVPSTGRHPADGKAFHELDFCSCSLIYFAAQGFTRDTYHLSRCFCTRKRSGMPPVDSDGHGRAA